uniref:hypothetical protein n=1 Tax=Stappia sp. TaxID=1870903 RepID=UPI003BAA803B
MRTGFERQYVTAFSTEAHPDAVAAFNATPPVRRKFFPGSGGLYRADAHYIVAPARWRGTAAGRVWVGVVAHELGHAVDLSGRAGRVGRSVWLAPAIRQDRACLECDGGLPPKAFAGNGGAAGGRAGTLAVFPDAARERLLALADGGEAASLFAVQWWAGRAEVALAGLSRRLETLAARRRDGGCLRLARYGLRAVGDFIGAVYDLRRGWGHSRAYYRGHGQILGPHLTVGHVAEAFANAFMADVIEGTELLSFLMSSAAPYTYRAYRMLVARIGRACGAGRSPNVESKESSVVPG